MGKEEFGQLIDGEKGKKLEITSSWFRARQNSTGENWIANILGLALHKYPVYVLEVIPSCTARYCPSNSGVKKTWRWKQNMCVHWWKNACILNNSSLYVHLLEVRRNNVTRYVCWWVSVIIGCIMTVFCSLLAGNPAGEYVYKILLIRLYFHIFSYWIQLLLCLVKAHLRHPYSS